MAPTKIPYSYALDERGFPVRIEDAVKGKGYFCPCSKPPKKMIAKWGEIRTTHYFAHLPDEECTGESLPHFIAKHLVKAGLSAHISGHGSYPFNVGCTQCERRINLPPPSDLVRVETEIYMIPKVQSDVGLLGEADRPLAAVEIEYTHPTDPNTAERYRAAKLTVFWKKVNRANVFELGAGFIGEVIIGEQFCDACAAKNTARLPLNLAAKEWVLETRNALRTPAGGAYSAIFPIPELLAQVETLASHGFAHGGVIFPLLFTAKVMDGRVYLNYETDDGYSPEPLISSNFMDLQKRKVVEYAVLNILGKTGIKARIV